MRHTGSGSEIHLPVDWLDMEQRLRKIEDELISIRTVANLMLDLLERALPPIQAEAENDSPLQER